MTAADNQQKAPPSILILSSTEVEEAKALNDRFVRQLNQQLGETCTVEWHNYHDIGLIFDTNEIRAFLTSGGSILAGQELKKFSAVYFKSYFRFYEQAAAIAEYLAEHQVSFVSDELKSYIPVSKLTQYARLSRAGLPIPKTIYLSTEYYVDQYEYLKTELGDRFIFKAISASIGRNNHLIDSRQQLAAIIASSDDLHFVAQSFIPNKNDLRILIIDGDLRLIIQRQRHDNTTHLNNTSQGGRASLLEIDKFDRTLQKVALDAAAIMGRDVAGVDLMLESGSGNPYILEVNASPQIASGAFEAEKLAVYVDYFTSLVAKNEDTKV